MHMSCSCFMCACGRVYGWWVGWIRRGAPSLIRHIRKMKVQTYSTSLISHRLKRTNQRTITSTKLLACSMLNAMLLSVPRTYLVRVGAGAGAELFHPKPPTFFKISSRSAHPNFLKKIEKVCLPQNSRWRVMEGWGQNLGWWP